MLPPEIMIRLADYGSEIYRQTVQLREEILRKPLGMKLSPEELQRDVSDYHIVALQDNIVLACLVLMPLTKESVKMRQVAVASGQQGRGVGAKLVRWTEDFCRSKGFRSLCLHSRETAIGFYEKLGYKKIGDSFIEVTIPHRKMEKPL